MPPERDLLLPPVREDNICLPLSINAVSRYWDVRLPMSEAAEIAKKYPGVDGSIMIEGIELAERHALGCAVAHSGLDELRGLIDAGMPPIVILPGLGATIQHASVISGYDADEGTIIHYIPQPGSGGEFQMGAIPEGTFDSLWSEDGRLLIVIAPPGRMGGAPPRGDAERSNRLCFLSERQNLLGDSEGAVASLREALQLRPDNSTAHALLGSVLNGRGSPECVEHYGRALEINPRCYLALRGLGNHHIKRKEYAEAEGFYDRAVGVNPSRFGPVYKNRAICRMQRGADGPAREDLEAYLRLVPGARDAAEVRRAVREMG